jgi:protein ImuB
LSAPANHLRLRTIETLPWCGASKSLLPEENVKGERLHQLVERLSVRLGEHNVLVPVALADHRPEKMQRWEAARNSSALASMSMARAGGRSVTASALRTQPSRQGNKRQLPCDALYPPWLLPQPLRLEVRGEKPQYHGPLRLLAGPQRLETGWWDGASQGPAVRDYFVARSDAAGLLWVFRERLATQATGPEAEPAPVHWFLHGIYA